MAEYFSLRATTLQSPNYSHSGFRTSLSLYFLFPFSPYSLCLFPFFTVTRYLLSFSPAAHFSLLVYRLPHVFLQNMFLGSSIQPKCATATASVYRVTAAVGTVYESHANILSGTVSEQSVEYESHTICSVHEKSFRVLCFTTLDSIR